MDEEGTDERVDDAECECDNDFEGEWDSSCECGNDREWDNGLEFVFELDPASSFCDWYSEGKGKYVCRGDVGDESRSLLREYTLLRDTTVLVRVGGNSGTLCGTPSAVEGGEG